MTRLSIVVFSLLLVNILCGGGHWKDVDPSELPRRVLATVYKQFSSRINVNLLTPFELKIIENLKCQTVAGKNCLMVVKVANVNQEVLRFSVGFWWKPDQTVEVQSIKQMLNGQYVKPTAAMINAQKEAKKGGWRRYSTDELPLDQLEDAWNQFESKVNSNVAESLSLENIDSIWCQTVAGKKCKMTVTLATEKKSHRFTIVFWMKLDNSVELMDVVDLGEEDKKKQSVLKAVINAAGMYKSYTFEQLGNEIKAKVQLGMNQSVERTGLFDVAFSFGELENLRCQTVAGTRCLVDTKITAGGETEVVEFMFWIRPSDRSVEILGFRAKE